MRERVMRRGCRTGLVVLMGWLAGWAETGLALERFLPTGAALSPPLLVVADAAGPGQRQALLAWLGSAHEGGRPYPEEGLHVGLMAAVPDADGLVAPRILLPPLPLRANVNLPPMQRHRQVAISAGSGWSSADRELVWRLPLPSHAADVTWVAQTLSLPWSGAWPDTVPLALLPACDPWPACSVDLPPVWEAVVPAQAVDGHLVLDLLPVAVWRTQPQPERMTWRLGPLPPDGRPVAWHPAQPARWQLAWREPAWSASGLSHWQRALSGLLVGAGITAGEGQAPALAQALSRWLGGEALPQEGGQPSLAQAPDDCGRSAGRVLTDEVAFDPAAWSYWRDAALAPLPHWQQQASLPGIGWWASRLQPVPGQTHWPAALVGALYEAPPVDWPQPAPIEAADEGLQAGILRVLPAQGLSPALLLWLEGRGRVLAMDPARQPLWAWPAPPADAGPAATWPLPGPLDWWLTPTDELIGLAHGRLVHLRLQDRLQPRPGALGATDWPPTAVAWLPASSAGPAVVLLAGAASGQLQLRAVTHGGLHWQWAPVSPPLPTPAGFRHPWGVLTLPDGRPRAYGVDVAGQIWRLQPASDGARLQWLGQLPGAPPAALQRLPPLAAAVVGRHVRLALLASAAEGGSQVFVIEDVGTQAPWTPAAFRQLPVWPSTVPSAAGWQFKLPADEWLTGRPFFHAGDVMLPVTRWQPRRACAPPEGRQRWYRLSWAAAAPTGETGLVLEEAPSVPSAAPAITAEGELLLRRGDGQVVRLGPAWPLRWRKDRQRLPAW